MKFSRKAAPLLGLATLAALGLAAGPALAQANGVVLHTGNILQLDRNGLVGNWYKNSANPNEAINDPTITSISSTTTNAVAISAGATGTIFTVGDGGTVSSIDADGDSSYANSSNTVNVNGGTVSGGSQGIHVSYGTVLNITRGSVQGDAYAFYVGSDSTANISGGKFTWGATGSGFDNYGGVVNFYGSTFTVNGVTHTTDFSITNPPSSGTISGVLLNGDVLTDMPYADTPGGTMINFFIGGLGAPTDQDTLTPEPASWAAFAFMGLGAAGLMIKARRRVSTSAA